jgi:mannitol/fructose-specific phosphotransferase system IIA component (Ntr-type)
MPRRRIGWSLGRVEKKEFQHMNKNERKILLRMVRMNGHMVQALSQLRTLLRDDESQKKFSTLMDGAVESMNDAVQLMETEWSDEKN